ncbi:hypothetical protein [Mucilaginibacter myungsuensis]|uniref:DUF4007 domain-containing protein n=1 Tax=Mucilaginibacter myungsuensis TaxID=649104 RepID=A0A929PXC3_9SPHI|nr:hypothetical protein [Mucilaginibacter myungsuensis]MBE9663019.1 hypothetical protein [Mucilaginibacter myungsuensis]MDN3598649.1 hypothetical protein [Mucilaginibacter myungsuensis]
MQYLKEYQGFSIDLRDLAKVINLIGSGAIATKSELLEESGFGANKVRGYKEYLSDFELLAAKNQLTVLGQIIYKNDPRFRDPFTKWLLLYHWSFKANNPFLYFLVNDFSSSDDSSLLRKFKQWADRNQVKTDYESSKLNGLINRTKSALLEPEGFQSLNLFSVFDNVLQRSEPYNVHKYLTAYILYHMRKGRVSISFAELLDERNNVAKFFDWNSKNLESKMAELMDLKLVKLVHFADLHMVEFSYNGTPESLIERYYEEY